MTGLSMREYLAPLEDQLRAEGGLGFLPRVLRTLIGEYTVPRLAAFVTAIHTVILRPPCVLVTSSRLSVAPHGPEGAGAATAQEVFTVVHTVSLPRFGGYHEFSGAATIEDAERTATEHRPGVGADIDLANARRTLWARTVHRPPSLASQTVLHRSWYLDASVESQPATTDEDDGAAPDFNEVGNHSGSGDEQGPMCESSTGCALRWRAGPTTETPWGGKGAVAIANGCVTAERQVGRGNTQSVHMIALSAAASTVCSAYQPHVVAYGQPAPLTHTAMRESAPVTWMEGVMQMSSDTTVPQVKRLVAWQGHLYFYLFGLFHEHTNEMRIYKTVPLSSREPPDTSEVAESTPDETPTPTASATPYVLWVGREWALHHAARVSHSPNVFVAAPADASGILRLLALGGRRYERQDVGWRVVDVDTIVATPHPLAEWTGLRWRLPFVAQCTAAAFADDWLYVSSASHGSWAARWTPQLPDWPGPSWVRLPGPPKIHADTVDTAIVIM